MEQHVADKARYEAEKEAYARYLAEHPELGAAAAAASDEVRVRGNPNPSPSSSPNLNPTPDRDQP